MTKHTLLPHQQQALDRIREEERVALFMEMRLGKTPVIIRWVRGHRPTEPFLALVVAPMSTLDDWEDELRREGETDITRLDRANTKTRMEYAGVQWGWYLCHKEGVRITDELSTVPWDVVIVDESTIIRNPQAQITKTMIRRYGHVPLRAIMTGDPRPESEMDYFTQFQFLYGNFMGFNNYWVFRNVKFRQSAYQKYVWMPKPGTRDEIKEYVHSHAVVMTARQHGLGNVAIYKKRYVEQNDAQRAAIKTLIKDFQYEYIETNFATVRDIWLARVAGGFSPDRENPELISNAKTNEIVDILTGEMRRKSVVIWFRFNEELEHVVAALNKRKIPTAALSGRTPKDDRRLIRKQFTMGEYRVLCVQQQLGKMGWNLARADVAIYYSNHYEYEARAQSLKRIEHLTKKHALLYIDLVTRGSIDEEVVRALQEKKMTSQSFMRRLNSAVWAQLGLGRGREGKTQEKDHRQKTGHQKTRRIYPATR